MDTAAILPRANAAFESATEGSALPEVEGLEMKQVAIAIPSV
jgi:hypothetical protein